MTALDDALAELRTAAAGQVDAAVSLTAAATRHVADAQQMLALAARVAALAETAPPEANPDQTPNLVRIGAASYPLAAVNPTPTSNPSGAPFDGCRGEDQLILCRAPWSRSGTNRFGAEVAVEGGELVGSITVGGVGGIAIPAAGGYVLSGHGKASTFLQQAFKAGAAVELLGTGHPGSPPTVPPAAGGRTLAVYLMDGVGHVSQIPANVTQARVAFLQGTSLVEWGGDTPAQTADGLRGWRTGRRETLVAIGGAGGSVSMGGIVGAFHTIETVDPWFPTNGPDWDVEGGRLDVPSSVAVSKELARGRGDSWVTSFVPPGGDPVPVYLEAARQCQAAGLRVQFGQQLYEAEVSQSAAVEAIGRAVKVLGQESVLVGMMIGPGPKFWSVDQCEANMLAVLDKYPRIGGAYLWESARPGTAEWARRVGAVLGL